MIDTLASLDKVDLGVDVEETSTALPVDGQVSRDLEQFAMVGHWREAVEPVESAVERKLDQILMQEYEGRTFLLSIVLVVYA